MNTRHSDWIATLLPALVGALTAWFASEGTAHFIAQLLLLGMFAAAFDLAYGVTGIFSFGHAAFFGGGAYAYATFSMMLGWGFGPSIAASAVAGALLALAFGLLAYRAAGLYFALATLALGQLVNILIEVKFRAWSGGSDGMAVLRPVAFGYDFGGTNDFLIFASVCFAIVMTCLAALRNSGYGQTLRAIRDNPVRAGQLGYHVARYRLSAYTISGAVSGVSGALFGALMMFVSPDLTRWSVSGDVLIMTVLGGAGTLLGPLLGVAVFEVAKEVLSAYTEHWYGLLGALFIGCTLFLPRGLYGLMVKLSPLKRPTAQMEIRTRLSASQDEPL